jgi:hypothetical protein
MAPPMSYEEMKAALEEYRSAYERYGVRRLSNRRPVAAERTWIQKRTSGIVAIMQRVGESPTVINLRELADTQNVLDSLDRAIGRCEDLIEANATAGSSVAPSATPGPGLKEASFIRKVADAVGRSYRWSREHVGFLASLATIGAFLVAIRSPTPGTEPLQTPFQSPSPSPSPIPSFDSVRKSISSMPPKTQKSNEKQSERNRKIPTLPSP